MDERQTFREAAHEHGLPGEAVDWWLQLARPRLELTRAGDGPVVGRFGGRPALPVGVEWPRKMACLATVDLAAIPAGSHDLNLPARGHLVFFAEPEIVPDDCTVIYVPAGVPVLEQSRPDDAHPRVYESFPLHSRPGWSMPRERWQSTFDLGDSIHDEGAIGSIMGELDAGDDFQVAIGGYGDECTSGVGNPLESPAAEVLLGQVYLSDDLVGQDFGGSGLCIVSFLIAHPDLAARQFDKARFASDFMG